MTQRCPANGHRCFVRSSMVAKINIPLRGYIPGYREFFNLSWLQRPPWHKKSIIHACIMLFIVVTSAYCIPLLSPAFNVVYDLPHCSHLEYLFRGSFHTKLLL